MRHQSVDALSAFSSILEANPFVPCEVVQDARHFPWLDPKTHVLRCLFLLDFKIQSLVWSPMSEIVYNFASDMPW
jgi:hypothetical protein